MRTRFHGILLAAAGLAVWTAGGTAQAQGPELTKTAVEHGLSMAISGAELHALGSQLKTPEADKLVKAGRKEIQDSSDLLTAAYEKVKSQPGSSPTQKYYNAVSQYTKTLMKHTESPTPAAPEEVARVTQINCAVKAVSEAHKLEKKAKGETSAVAESLRSHAQKMRSNAKKTLDEVRQKAKAGSTVEKLATQAKEVCDATEKL